MRKLATFTAVAAVVAFGFAGAAHAGKGIFEGPMVIDTTGGSVGVCTDNVGTVGECDGSEGKVESNGDWKVEINGVDDLDADAEYEVCLFHTGGQLSLARGLEPDGDPGELKATESSADANIVTVGIIYQQPSLVVVVDNDAGGCNADILFETGFAL